ncbi:MAG TPA: energy transducer TonB [Caulobacteraceae bacterium]|jgi:hypothetical protein
MLSLIFLLASATAALGTSDPSPRLAAPPDANTLIRYEACAGLAAAIAQSRPDPTGKARTRFIDWVYVYSASGLVSGLKPSEIDRRLEQARLKAQARLDRGEIPAEAAACDATIDVNGPIRPRPVRPAVITNPDWITRPNSDQLLAAFPKDALDKGVSGDVQLECQVEVDTTLSGCAVIKEDPPGMGFGAAGLSLAATMHMRPQTVDGKAVRGARVIVPLNFKVAPDFDMTLAESLPDAERCLGYAFQQASDPGSDSAYRQWTEWFTGDALAAKLSPADASARLIASTHTAAEALKTQKGATEAAVCRRYYEAWKAQS